MIEQGSDEWRLQRMATISASRFKDVLSVTKAGKPSEANKKYKLDLVFELLADTPKQSRNAPSLSWGKEVEQHARDCYELETGTFIKKSEFILSKELPYVGCSPDGLISSIGGVEIKCPYDESVHVETLLNGMPQDHMPQIQGALLVTERLWWDFISFDPRQSEKYKIYLQRIYRDEEYIKKLREKLILFWDDVLKIYCEIKNKKGKTCLA